MKTFKLLFKTVLILILSFTAFTSCNNDDETMPGPITNTIVDFVSNSPDYSILLEALQLANGNLPNVLDGEGPFQYLLQIMPLLQRFYPKTTLVH